MLRTYVVAGIIVLVLIFGGYWHNQYINQSATTLVKKFAYIEELIQERNWESVNQEIEKVKLDWHETKNYWSVLLNHQEIDNIDLSLKRVEKYIVEKESALSLGEVSALQLLFDHIAETETITLQNIF